MSKLSPKLQQAQELLIQLRNLIVSLETEMPELALQEKTHSLLTEQISQSKSVLADLQKRQSSQQAEYDQKQAGLDGELVKAKADMAKEIAHGHLQLDKLSDDVKEASLDLHAIDADTVIAVAERDKLLSEVSGLRMKQEDFKSSVAKLDTTISSLQTQQKELASQIAKEKEQYEELLTNHNQSISDLIKQQDEIRAKSHAEKQTNIQNELSNEAVRKDLASRMRQLDDREDVLKRREILVEQNEDKIQRNSDLLSL